MENLPFMRLIELKADQYSNTNHIHNKSSSLISWSFFSTFLNFQIQNP